MSKNSSPRMSGPTIKTLTLFLELYPRALSGADVINEKKVLSGTLYPILDRLEGCGWLQSEWEQIDPKVAGRPKRKFYRLTGEGRRRSLEELAALGIEVGRPASGPVFGTWWEGAV